MSKITFRADDDLVERLEACDASKSEVMRNALRAYLDERTPDDPASDSVGGTTDSVDDLLADRIDELLAERLDAALGERFGHGVHGPSPAYTPPHTGELTVNVTLDAPNAEESDASVSHTPAVEADASTRKTAPGDAVQTPENACGGCGENVPEDHVYCPNCGSKQSHRAFCECGDEVRTDWSFCPGCGRRTPAADVLGDR
ncbi:double zinc ribbon domain-containing protein [Halorubrum vacuolatum]|uniref:Ribbon-helix-helix protein, copG family n=1 Tax=Halorubrum vacuolatum TaxID=63740 RepID=A0A238VNG7_HALVU|nr:zinc ribbon domain-containing protein [Halorubrum vacuolatum]SNR35905.1 Ribbon-helix-helix protein, copG family [Halorubrum vacuolatum]